MKCNTLFSPEKCFKKLGTVLCGTLRANLLPILDCISAHEAFMILCFSYMFNWIGFCQIHSCRI